MPYRYHLLNVFTRDASPLSGNPLCVFENGRGLDDATLQALARQRAERASARRPMR